jgi:TRAP-type C4-dicarboxylate transport system permease large subunit
MGNIMNGAGITERIFAFATVCVGWLRGGLCHANILACVIFAGMSGSAVADAGGVGTLEIKAMKNEGCDPDTAAAITAASATIGPIIPTAMKNDRWYDGLNACREKKLRLGRIMLDTRP